MIDRIVGASVERRHLVVTIWALVTAAALVLATRLKLDALPDLTNRQVQILTRAPGLTPEEVEMRVTRPLEIALGGLPDLENHRSVSRYGLSAITAVFDDNSDLYRARQLVAERLGSVSLPDGVSPPELGPMTGGLGEIFHLTLTSPRRTPSELLSLAELRVAPVLRSVPGVVEVNTWGGAQRTLAVRLDPIRLAQHHLTIGDVRTVVEHAIGGAPGAAVPVGDRQILLRAVARPTTPAELGEIVIRDAIRLADVATIEDGTAPRIGAATANGHGETVYVMAQMLLGGNARDVTAGVRERLPEVRRLLPEDVELRVVYDRSQLVDGTLVTISHNLLEGGALVIAVLLLMLGRLRAGLVVALGIPIAMIGATAVMVLLGVPGNLMSLGAIDFGLLVDGGVVLIERVFHDLGGRHCVSDADRVHRVRAACQTVATPMFSSVLVILLVYVPVLTMTGVDGKLFRPMAVTVVLALATALLAALTLVPALAALVLRGNAIPARPPRIVRAIDSVYVRLLGWLPKLRIPIATVAILLLVLAGVLFRGAGSELTPQLDEGDLVIQTTRAPDLGVSGAVAQAGKMESALLAVPEVRQVVSRIGSPAVATDVMGLEQADVFVGLQPRSKWRAGLTRDALIAELHARIESATPGSEPAFTQPIQMRFNELLGGASTDVVVSVFGDDLVMLHRLAESMAAAVSAEPGVVDVRVLAPDDVPLTEVRPRPFDTTRHQLTNADVLDAVEALRFGVPLATTFDGPRVVPIVALLDTRGELADALVPGPAGAALPLDTVADVTTTTTPAMIQHERGQRRLTIGFNVRGVDLGHAVAGAQKRASLVPLPRSYSVTWGGQHETLQAAHRRLRIVMPLVLALITAVLMITFRRARHALIILTHVPFACVGGVVALALRGLPISMSAAIGFIALSGIAVMNGVVLLSQVRLGELAGLAPADAIVAAARERARPVLMTALVAALGFIPMMLATGIGAEVQRPLATVVVGGLLTSTLLTLVILPAVYPWLGGKPR